MNKYETKMDKITTEFAEHICDNLCRYPHMADGKSLEIICSECKIGKFIPGGWGSNSGTAHRGVFAA